MNNILEGASDILTSDEVANYLGVHKNTIYNLCKSGELPSFKIGNNRRIRTEKLREYIKSQEDKQEMNS
ncbi:helix-turn-helix domain-containing protein [Halolactibacillus sp. JCM 19043]|uniref:helix-turn-helix domain-containing protein n=1 Tax=Halolactibacillus sp. JCM 19043 TaxID=1460638 RepID=UPI0007847BC5|nr:helix-turn-helix domain-containing protein [Halolactibacillus sp. JCM 19043]